MGRHHDADRLVVEFNKNLEAEEVTEADAMRWSDGISFALDDSPNFGECGGASFHGNLSAYVNLQVPSDNSQMWDIWLDSVYRSDDTAKVPEVEVCPPHEGRAYFAVALSEPGEIDAFILTDPGRVVIDVR